MVLPLFHNKGDLLILNEMRMSNYDPINHYLKIKEEYLSRIVSGQKTFEVRFNDRDYQIGDILSLTRDDSRDEVAEYGGASQFSFRVRVIYVLDFPEALKEGWVILGIEFEKPEAE